jgi:hypothetical protein
VDGQSQLIPRGHDSTLPTLPTLPTLHTFQISLQHRTRVISILFRYKVSRSLSRPRASDLKVSNMCQLDLFIKS